MLKFLVAVFILITYANAVPNLGLTDLLYANKSAFQNSPHPTTPVESTTISSIIKFNTAVTQLLRTELANLEPQLQTRLTESANFMAYNAESKISAWKVTDPQLLMRWETESVVVSEESTATTTNTNKPMPLPLKNHSYILVGWITYINAHIDKELIEGTDKKSILYNLDVQVKYKIFDSETKREVTEFDAKGHGGYATIVPVTATVSNYNPEVPVKNAISSLLSSVQHGLLMKQTQGDLD